MTDDEIAAKSKSVTCVQVAPYIVGHHVRKRLTQAQASDARIIFMFRQQLYVMKLRVPWPHRAHTLIDGVVYNISKCIGREKTKLTGASVRVKWLTSLPREMTVEGTLSFYERHRPMCTTFGREMVAPVAVNGKNIKCLNKSKHST